MPQQRDTIKSILKMREGWRNKPYKDENGFMTVGWGHNISSNGLPQAIRENVKKYGYITLDEGNQLLETDIQIAVDACKKLYSKFDLFSLNRQDALIDFVFNVGIGKAKQFKETNKFINNGQWAEASREIKNSVWYTQVGDRAKEISMMLYTG